MVEYFLSVICLSVFLTVLHPGNIPVESFWWGETKGSEAENGIAEIYEYCLLEAKPIHVTYRCFGKVVYL